MGVTPCYHSHILKNLFINVGRVFALLMGTMTIQHSRHRPQSVATQSSVSTHNRVGGTYGQRRQVDHSQQTPAKQSGTIQKIKDLFGFSKEEVHHAPNAQFERGGTSKTLKSIENRAQGPHYFSDEKLVKFLSLISEPATKKVIA